MSVEKFKYDFLEYDRYHALRPHWLLKLVFLYYLKDIFIVVAVAATAFKAQGNASSELSALVKLASPRLIFSDIPMVLLAFAWSRRTPNAGAFIRAVWRNGRHMILAAAIVNSIMIWLLPAPGSTTTFYVYIGFLVVNVVTVTYVYRSEKVADVFADFPTTADPAPRK